MASGSETTRVDFRFWRVRSNITAVPFAASHVSAHEVAAEHVCHLGRSLANPAVPKHAGLGRDGPPRPPGEAMIPDSAALAIPLLPAKPFANHHNAMLADAMREIDIELETLEKRREMTRRHASAIEGARGVVVEAEKTQMRFSAEAAKLEVRHHWHDAPKRSVASTTFTVNLEAQGAQLATPASSVAIPAGADAASVTAAKAEAAKAEAVFRRADP
jgi:hypothetical protein